VSKLIGLLSFLLFWGAIAGICVVTFRLSQEDMRITLLLPILVAIIAIRSYMRGMNAGDQLARLQKDSMN